MSWCNRDDARADSARATTRSFGFFIVHFLPHGHRRACSIAAVLAAAMSSLSSSLNSSASAFVTDFYRPLRPGRSERTLLARVALDDVRLGPDAHRGGAGRREPGREQQASSTRCFAWPAFTTGMILGLFVLGSLRRPVRSGAALAGLVVGFVVVLRVCGCERRICLALVRPGRHA